MSFLFSSITLSKTRFAVFCMPLTVCLPVLDICGGVLMLHRILARLDGPIDVFLSPTCTAPYVRDSSAWTCWRYIVRLQIGFHCSSIISLGADQTKNSRLTSVIPTQYLVRLPIQRYVRQSRLGSDTRKTPG